MSDAREVSDGSGDEPAGEPKKPKKSSEAPPLTAPGLTKKPRRWKRIAFGAGGFLLIAGAGLALYKRANPADKAIVIRRLTIDDALPAASMLVVRVDLAELRRAPIVQPYLGGERELEGLGSLRTACGFDPLTSTTALALAVPPGTDADFGLAAQTTLSSEAVAECAEKVIRARGGNPVRSSLGSFQTIRDATQATGGELALRPDAPLLVGGGSFLRAMVDAADGTLPSLSKAPMHQDLAQALLGTDTLLVTLVLTADQRKTVQEELARAPERAPQGIGSISAAGLGLELDQRGAKLRIVVECDDEAAANLLRQGLIGLRSEADRSPQLTLLGAAPLVQKANFETSGKRLMASLDATTAELEAVAERALTLRSLLQRDQGAAPPRPASAAPTAAPTVPN